MSQGSDTPTPDERDTVDIGVPSSANRRAHKDPESIGAYRILEKIGEGGMGVVYKAEQREPVRRIVALKVIKLGMDTKEVVARFEAERQALAMLSHPNVARVFEAGITASGTPFFAMEHVPGVPLTDYCNLSRLSTRQRLELFIPVCQAIQHAHQKGIIHRDLKPSNILVQMFDGGPVPKVIDFGIAKATNSALTQHTLFTQTGSMVGTPEYMSPEQAMTSGLDVDTRTDIYSLGVVLYELLTGSLPFDPKTLREAGMQGMARIIRETEPQKPSTRLITLPGGAAKDSAVGHHTDVKTLKREISGDLDWITLKAMEKDRTRRYETANGFAVDIQRHLDDEPVLARPPSTAYRVSKFVRKHRAGVVAAVVVTAALLVAIIGTSIGWIQTRAALHRAETAEAAANDERNRVKIAQGIAEKEAKRAVAANEFMRNMLSSAQSGPKLSGKEVKVVDVLDAAAISLDRLGDQPELELDGRITLAASFDSLNLYPKSYLQYSRALVLSRRLTGAESEQTLQITADMLRSTAMGAYSTGSVPVAKETVETARRVFGDHHRLTWDTLNAQGLILNSVDRFNEAEVIFRQLVQESHDHPEVADPKGASRFYNNLALVLSNLGRHEESERIQRQGIELAKVEASTDLPRVARAQVNLGNNLISQNRMAEAEAALREGISNYHKTVGDTHPRAISAMAVLAIVLEQKGDFAAALKQRQELIPLVKESYLNGSDSENEANIGELLVRIGHEIPARQAFESALKSLRKRAISEPALVASCKNWSIHASLLLDLRIDKTWAGSAIEMSASDAAWQGLLRCGWVDPPLDAIDWDKMHFKIEPYPSGAPVAEGGRAELWSAADPKPGIYLFSISMPRRDGTPPIRHAKWMWVAPWKVSLHTRPDALTLPEEGKWAALFASEPAERLSVPMLYMQKYGFINYGFGPLHRAYGFSASATTTAKFPPGDYQLQIRGDIGNRVFIDGKKLLDSWNSPFVSIKISDDATSPSAEIRLETAIAENGLMMTIEPQAARAKEMRTAAVGALHQLEVDIEKLDSQISAGEPTAAMYQSRGELRARRGRFKEAAADYVKALELDKNDIWIWYRSACIFAYLEDKERYRDVCKGMIQRYAKPEHPEYGERTAKAAMLLPSAFNDLPACTKLIDDARAARGEVARWVQITKGLAEYRAGSGHYDSAMDVLEQARQKHDPKGIAAATCELITAMALYKTEKQEQAQHTLAGAIEIANAIGNTPGVDDFGNQDLENRLIFEILRREAEALINGGKPKP